MLQTSAPILWVPHEYSSKRAPNSRAVFFGYQNQEITQVKKIFLEDSLSATAEFTSLLKARELSLAVPIPYFIDGEEVVMSYIKGSRLGELGPQLLKTPSLLESILQECIQFLNKIHRSPKANPLAHGDFGPWNILIDPASGKLSGIIDWENAGTSMPTFFDMLNLTLALPVVLYKEHLTHHEIYIRCLKKRHPLGDVLRTALMRYAEVTQTPLETVISSIPVYLKYMSERIRSSGRDPRSFSYSVFLEYYEYSDFIQRTPVHHTNLSKFDT